MRHYYLGLAANYSTRDLWRHTFAVGRKTDLDNLTTYLCDKYSVQNTTNNAQNSTSGVQNSAPGVENSKAPVYTILTKNGRSGLAIALLAYFKPGDAVIVNGFTCFAVYEALKKAKIKPLWADISPENLNFTLSTLKAALRTAEKRSLKARGIIVQNSLGHSVDMAKIEKFAAKHELTIIEDLAHSTGVHYPDGREAGTIGSATVLSFGKDKAIDTISGGAVILRKPLQKIATPDNIASIPDILLSPYGLPLPHLAPRPSDSLRARFYPLLGLLTRFFSYLHLSGVFMRLMLKIHWVERSADNHLDLTHSMSKFEAKLALKQLKKLDKIAKTGQNPPKNAKNLENHNNTANIENRENIEKRENHTKNPPNLPYPFIPLRNFYLVKKRTRVLRELQNHGYYFSGIWYEKPVSPERYYPRVKFPEKECPVATEVSQEIINFPTYYTKEQLAHALEIVQKYQISEKEDFHD